jgi:hypothetical protein
MVIAHQIAYVDSMPWRTVPALPLPQPLPGVCKLALWEALLVHLGNMVKVRV